MADSTTPTVVFFVVAVALTGAPHLVVRRLQIRVGQDAAGACVVVVVVTHRIAFRGFQVGDTHG